MPYTPPSHNSPSTSRPESPAVSRLHLYPNEHQHHVHHGHHESPLSGPGLSRAGLPRSTASVSYLHKHRRSPSFTKAQHNHPSPFPEEQPGTVNGAPAGQAGGRSQPDPHGSLRRSPPPVNDSLMPIGAIATPPESGTNSSDDDEESSRNVSIRQLENLEELQAAIRVIEQRRASSPDRSSEEARKAKMALDIVVPRLRKSLDVPSGEKERPPLSKEARKISHSRSSTQLSVLADMTGHAESACRTSDDSDADEVQITRVKPPMLRKKSGELVRPALRHTSTKRRPSSMPGTPTYSKAVHFDSHLEHVRHFLQVDRPLAVSAGSSPVEQYESDFEFPFGSGDEAPPSKGRPYEWEIKLANFPRETEERKLMPVCVERIFLSSDNKQLVGVVAVQNIAYSKQVIARFTVDYWKTTSEVVAEYNNDVSHTTLHDDRDRFNFSVRLADLAHIENKTMFICVRYNVDGREFWDNNSSTNYQVDFTRKMKPQSGQNTAAGTASRHPLPRSRPSPPQSTDNRPKTSLAAFDDFSTGTFDSFATFAQSPARLMGESPVRLKKKSSDEILPDAPTRKTSTAGHTLSNRYDFGASLASAIQGASNTLGDRSGFKPEDRPQSRQKSTVATPSPVAGAASLSNPATAETSTTGVTTRGWAPGTKEVPGTTNTTKMGAPLFADKPTLPSSSYQELVDKYCFFGSVKTSPQLTKPTPGQVGGAHDDPASRSAVDPGSVKTCSISTVSRKHSPPTQPEKKFVSTPKSMSPHLPRSTSPTRATGSGLGSRSTSPISFGYPYHQPMQNGLFAESHTPTATYG